MDMSRMSTEELQAIVARARAAQAPPSAPTPTPAPRRDWKAEDPAQYDPASPEFKARYGLGQRGPLASAGLGALSALSNVGLHGLRIGQRVLGDREGAERTTRDIEAQRAADAAYSEGNVAFDIGRFGGDVLATAPVGGVAGRAVGAGLGAAARLPMFPKALGAGRPLHHLSRLVGEGAAASALTTGEAVEGGLAAAGLSMLGRAGARIARGRQMAPEARRLVAAGVDLTPGQLRPTGIINQLEQSIQSTPGIGAMMQNARRQAEQSARVAMVKAAVPGATGQTFDDALESAIRTTDRAYAQFKGHPVRWPALLDPKAAIGRTLAADLDDPTLYISTAERAKAARYMDTQLSRVRERPTTDALLSVRSDFRAKARALRQGRTQDEQAAAELFERAATRVSPFVEQSLPAAQRAALRQTDAQYAKLKVLTGAAHRGAAGPDGPGFGALERAARRTMTDTMAARAAGRQARQMPKDAQHAFQVTDRATGARLMSAPGGLVVSPITLAMAGTETGRRLARGQTGPQRAAQAVMDDALTQSLVERLRSAGAVGGVVAAIGTQGEL